MIADHFLKVTDGFWVTFRDNVKVKIIPLTKPKARALVNQCTTVVYGRRGKETEKFDVAKYDDLAVPQTVVDWEGLEDSESDPIPFNKENLMALFNNWPEFAAFVQDVSLNIQDYLDKEAQVQEKN